jgi:hypothetical protein
MTDATNPREVIGGNIPPLGQSISAEDGDFALITTGYLEDAYDAQPRIVASLLEEARDIPREIVDDATKDRVTSLIKRIRDSVKAMEAFHDKEKAPYLRGGQAVDQFFFGLIDSLARRARNGRPGAADVLNARLTDYDTRLLEAERARRREEEERQARIAREAQEKAAREAREAEEARLAAERARKPEIVTEKTAAADQAASRANEAEVEATIAAGKAQEAHIDTLAKPADIMRRRGEDGTLSTMATEAYAIVEDYDLLDIAKLRPFLSHDALDKALRAWAKVTNYSQQMPGASIGRKPKSVVR